MIRIAVKNFPPSGVPKTAYTHRLPVDPFVIKSNRSWGGPGYSTERIFAFHCTNGDFQFTLEPNTPPLSGFDPCH
ncbi:MAG: hypothetical protein CM15mP120_21380 [Pseudomonadota bacterium]|nr:MAG: hypothetical protein CM15mP120_21380 [Pseudomonadota bacterium]